LLPFTVETPIKEMERALYNNHQESSILDLRELLKPYTKEELQSMLIELAQSHQAIYQQVANRIASDPKWCKLFVHGLAFNTTKQSLAMAYSQFGAVKETVVLLEQHDRSKGYGFVVFESAAAARRAAMAGTVFIDGRETKCDFAFKGNPKKVVLQQPVISPEQRLAADGRRLFIHDLAWKTTNETLRRHFLQYGDIQEAVVIHDRKTGKSKGFGFVTFLSAQSARDALREPVKRIDHRNAKVAFAKATKDAVSASPYISPPPSTCSPGSDPGKSPAVGLPMLKRPSLDLDNHSNVSNASAVSSSSSRYPDPSTPSYSFSNSSQTLPIFTPNSMPNVNGWAVPPLGFPALTGSLSEHSTPAMTSTPPLVSMPQTPVVLPSMLQPPPPSPHSLGIPTTSHHGGELKGFALVANVFNGLPPTLVVPQQNN